MTEVAEVQRPGARGLNYPVTLELSNAMRRRSENAWRSWLESNRAPFADPDLDPALGVPRSLPSELAQKILLTDKTETLSPEGVKEALRQFITRGIRLLGGESQDRTITLQDLSLISLSVDGNFYRATYRQMNFPFLIVNGYGELKLTMTKQGALIQLTSTLLPVVDLPARPVADPTPLRQGMVGRTFRYRGIDGRELEYRVSSVDEVSIKDPVILPREDGARLLLHLAYPIEVGRGLNWTVFVDAVNGDEIEVKQNFNT